jgi:hypothetical protein
VTLDTVHKNRPEIGQADRVYESDGLLPALNGGWTPQIEAKGLNTTEDGASYCIDSNYMKGTSPGDIGSGRRTQIIQNHRNIEIRNHGQESPTLNKKQGGGQLPMVLNHQFRPETRPSIEQDGQSGRSGLLYNSDYSYPLSSSPHYLVDDSFLAMEDELRIYEDVAPSQRSGTFNMKVVEIWDDYNSKMREDGNTGALTQNFGSDAVRNGNKILELIPLKNDSGTVYSKDGRRLSRHYDEGIGIHWKYEDYNVDFAEIPDKVQPCLTPGRVDKRQNGRRMKEDNDPMFTLTGQDIHGVTENKKRIRKLTPKECWRLQGFPDWAFDRAVEENSDTQLYKQAGNAVTVNVIEVLGQEIMEVRSP